MNRIDYASDTGTASPKGPLTEAHERNAGAATGNTSWILWWW